LPGFQLCKFTPIHKILPAREVGWDAEGTKATGEGAIAPSSQRRRGGEDDGRRRKERFCRDTRKSATSIATFKGGL